MVHGRNLPYRIFPAILLGGILVLMATFVLTRPGTALAQEKAACSNDVGFNLPIRGTIMEAGTSRIELDLTVCNNTQTAQEVRFEIDGAPAGWNVSVRTQFGLFGVTTMELASGSSKDMRIFMSPPATAKVGHYPMTLKMLSSTGTILQQADIEAEVLPKAQPEEPPENKAGIVLAAAFPVLRGPAASTFEFEVTIRNTTGADASFNLSAEAPQGWSVSFTPAFDNKLISSISIINLNTDRVKVKVESARQAEPGAYPIVVTVGTDKFEEKVLLRADITGSFDAVISTPTGQLNLEATAGNPSPATLRIGNSGNAPLEDMAILSDAPAGWQVKFDESQIENLAPQEIRDVPFHVTPPDDAIPGDYLITVHARNLQVLKSLELRITVTQSTVWGWVGIGLVVVVIAGLVGLFLRLGRR